MAFAADVEGLPVVLPQAELDVAALYAEHAPFIGRVIKRLLGDGSHVDDLLQETFIVAYKKRGAFDGRADVKTWLYGIAANLCMRHRRGAFRFLRLRERYQGSVDLASGPESPEMQMARREDVEAVRKAIDKLPFNQREVFILFELEGMEGGDIAKLTNLPLGTVWTRLKKAREQFLKLMRRQAMLGGER
jgi:RNA polymerase sigma-70 factor (ECF subfamily)